MMLIERLSAIGVMPGALNLSKERRLDATVEQEKYKKEFTYLAAYSLIKQVQAQGDVDIAVLKRLNKRCAEIMGCEPIPL